jgi:cytochrome oxidase Cu insertion factor (SCO1/SenC/PrrC family)
MKRLFQALAGSALTLLLFGLTGAAQTNPPLGPKDGATLPPADLNRVKVGAPAPDFTLTDQDGRAVTLTDYRNRKTVVLVFYRGYW